MKNISLISILSIFLLTACGSQNPDRQAPPEEAIDYVTVEGSQTASLKDPKVNILFVVDNSGSMQKYQDKLAKNIELFSTRFFKNNRIDYRIGVVPVYDSKYLDDQTIYRSGKRKMNALAELVTLKGLDPSDNPNQLFITRHTINPQKVLQQTVAIGTQWGPEAEESFSPALAIADEIINTQKNNNFYEQDAYLALIFLTDADDVTPGLSGEDFYQQLVQLKNGDRSKILIAAALPNLNSSSSECSKDGRGPVQSFPALLAVSGAIYADLCSDTFGARLADFGKYLVQRVASEKISLNFTPDIESLQVSYGPIGSAESERIRIPRGLDGYLFDTQKNEVLISPEINLPQRENSIIFVKAKPADLSHYKNGRLKTL